MIQSALVTKKKVNIIINKNKGHYARDCRGLKKKKQQQFISV